MQDFVRELTREQCLTKLRAVAVGRVAVTSKALPAIVPVNYVLNGNSVIFRTEPGGMLARGCDSTVVAFEIDALSVDGRSGWSVLVVGVAELLAGSVAVRATATGLVSAAGDGLDQFVAVTIGQLTGRAIERVPEPAAAGACPAALLDS
jgi:nitroimidazol reductase NimA-like FMN-containing flavoprotein (pyridoxamine 5'-phosphate oxidase superfamily)